MPFLRVLRDKRGYETTYLMHWFRDGARQRSKILYVFRTPPGVRVGRQALDPAIIRELEAQHPDIEFDWRAIVDNQQIIETSAEPRRRSERNGRHHEKGGDSTHEARPPLPPAVAPPDESDAVSPPRPAVPSSIDGNTRDEQMAFLVRWYPELRERIPHRTKDPIRREALLALVERLNPGAWTDDEQVTAGLTHAAEALQRLSRIFSKRRRRARRPSIRTGRPEAAVPDRPERE